MTDSEYAIVVVNDIAVLDRSGKILPFAIIYLLDQLLLFCITLPDDGDRLRINIVSKTIFCQCIVFLHLTELNICRMNAGIERTNRYDILLNKIIRAGTVTIFRIVTNAAGHREIRMLFFTVIYQRIIDRVINIIERKFFRSDPEDSHRIGDCIIFITFSFHKRGFSFLSSALYIFKLIIIFEFQRAGIAIHEAAFGN